MMEKRQLVLQESASQLPPETPLKFVDPPEDAGLRGFRSLRRPWIRLKGSFVNSQYREKINVRFPGRAATVQR